MELFTDMGLCRRSRKTRLCNSEGASHAVRRMQRFSLRVGRYQPATHATVRVHTRRTALRSLVPPQFCSRVFSSGVKNGSSKSEAVFQITISTAYHGKKANNSYNPVTFSCDSFSCKKANADVRRRSRLEIKPLRRASPRSR